ncbi:MAG: hypothetical protein CFE31_02595 [Rhizobiales bacterium PAR1]|nr:MAG: hypothetical protein CFE31_02595 [Rhizobiales bacterium PAR1]
MTFRNIITASAITLAGMLAATAGQAQEATRHTLKVGTLRCNVSAGLGEIIMSTRDMNCRFQPSRGRSEVYVGTIRRYGLDIGVTTRGVLLWSVMAEQRGTRTGLLAGEYDGVSAEATVGVGLGANALIGGSNRSISLQPVSVQGQVGLNLAAGVAQLTLASVQRRR